MTAATDIELLAEAWNEYADWLLGTTPGPCVWVPNKDGTGRMVFPKETWDDHQVVPVFSSLEWVRARSVAALTGLLRSAVKEKGPIDPTCFQVIGEILDRHQVQRTWVPEYWVTARVV